MNSQATLAEIAQARPNHTGTAKAPKKNSTSSGGNSTARRSRRSVSAIASWLK